MLDLFPDSEYDALVIDLERIVSFLPIEVLIEEDPKQVWVKRYEASDDEEHISALAEYLRMSKRTISELREIEQQISYAALKHVIPVLGILEIGKYIDTLAGEMALQEAFPRRAPSWRLYHVNPEEPWSYT